MALFQTLMMLRRFSFMNYLPIPALKAQGSFREAINVRHFWQIEDNSFPTFIKRGVLEEILRRRKESVETGGKDLLGRLCEF
jgi:hypothetical protein